jgi:hypothetical protein
MGGVVIDEILTLINNKCGVSCELDLTSAKTSLIS